MTMLGKNSLVLAAVAALMPLSAFAQDTGAGRFTMHKSEDGFVRLDTRTGAVSLCEKGTDGWACRAMADSNSSLRVEIEQLKEQNVALRKEVKRLEDLLGLNGGGKQRGRYSFQMPTEKDVDGALDYFERMLRKFQDRLKRLEKDKADTPKQL